MRSRIESICLALLILAVTQPTSATPDVAKIIANCAKERNDVDRLACYDSGASALGLRGVSKAVPIFAWKVKTGKSPIDDSTNVWVSRKANSPIDGWPNKSVTPMIYITCREKKTRAYIYTDMSPAIESTRARARGTIRLDGDEAYTDTFGVSTSGDALFLKPGDESALLGFLRELSKHKKMLVQFTPFNSPPTMTTFDLAGLSDALKPVQDACGWSP